MQAADREDVKPWRGLVVSPPIESTGTILKLKSGVLDPQALRSSLLFWDRLDFPDQRLIKFGLNSDAEFLASAGVLKRTEVKISGSGDFAAAVRDAQVAAFRYLDKENPGRWSLATGEPFFSFGDESLEPGRGALVRLYGAVPVPDKDVPLQDILEFRVRRSDELLALRTHLETVYQRVISAGDGELAWNTEIEALQRAIQDHIKTSRESGFRLRLADLSASLNLYTIGSSAIAAYTAGLPMVRSLINGAVAGLSVEVGAALKHHKPSPTPFQYITSYHDEVF
ncbi:DUF6236 family protein [Ancylobacter terrae]|uniref:DUF6236 family protein n=1 Tax=Ancylobacter sp. sgz301288 TaxID=3342077 RepID=UPI00385C1CAF